MGVLIKTLHIDRSVGLRISSVFAAVATSKSGQAGPVQVLQTCIPRPPMSRRLTPPQTSQGSRYRKPLNIHCQEPPHES